MTPYLNFNQVKKVVRALRGGHGFVSRLRFGIHARRPAGGSQCGFWSADCLFAVTRGVGSWGSFSCSDPQRVGVFVAAHSHHHSVQDRADVFGACGHCPCRTAQCW